MSEPIVIILQTYKRTDVAIRAVAAARAYLRYPDLRWYVADDGSPEAHVDAVMDALEGARIIGGHSERLGYGATANRAIRAAESESAILLFLEDDWELRQPLDLWPYAALLMESAEIGMVRLGNLNLDVRGRTWGHNGLLYWKLVMAYLDHDCCQALSRDLPVLHSHHLKLLKVGRISQLQNDFCTSLVRLLPR